MTDKFAGLEEPKSNAVMLVVVAFGLIFMILASRLFTSASEPIQGVVETIDPMRVIDGHGASVEAVSVRLTDGSIVPAQAANGASLHVGDQVRVMELRTSGAKPSYQAIVQAHGSKP
jgi:hypothetical protein